MAIFWAFRIAVAIGVVVGRTRAYRQLEVQPGKVFLLNQLYHRMMADPDVSDDELVLKISAATGSLVRVTTISGDFETRKLHVLWGRTSGGAVPEDDVMTTMHLVKLVGGVPQDTWLDSDFVSVETNWDSVWGVMKHYYSDVIRLKQYRWYKAGPQVEQALGGTGRTGEPVRVVDKNVPGESTGVSGLPPQVALSLTEKTSSARHWGRMYLPAPMAAESGFNTVGHAGRWATPFTTAVIDAFHPFYSGQSAAGRPVVVYSAAKPVRPSAGGGTLPAAPARAFTVDELQIDDIPDVIRSRRFDAPLLRLQRSW